MSRCVPAAERVDASGDLVDLVSMTIVNHIKIHLPSTLGRGISPELMKQIEKHGAYTKSLHSVKAVLNPTAVKSAMHAMLRETGTWLNGTLEAFGLEHLSDLNVARVARAVLGRPAVICGKTPMSVGTPIMHCDTKSRQDARRIVEQLARA